MGMYLPDAIATGKAWLWVASSHTWQSDKLKT